MNSDISKVRFGDDIYWGKNNRFSVIDEENLQTDEKSYLLFKWNDVLTNQGIRVRLAQFLAGVLNLNWIVAPNTTWSNIRLYIINIVSDSKDQSLSLVLDNSKKVVIVYQNRVEKAYDTLIEKYRLPARSFGGEWFVYSKMPRISAVVSIYRNLAENYENSLRYEEANQFYKREMEVRRRYREFESKSVLSTKNNSWIRRNLSLTGLYHFLFSYGLDYIKPIVLVIILALIPLFYSIWLNNPTLKPDFSLQGVSDVLNVTSSSLSETFGVKDKNITGYIIGTVIIPSIIVILLVTVKRKFKRKI